MPNDNQGALYSSLLRYLEAVKEVAGDDAKAMKAAPIHDDFTANGKVRARTAA